MAGYQIPWKEWNNGGEIPLGERFADLSRLPDGKILAYWAAISDTTEASLFGRGFDYMAGIVGGVSDPLHRFAFYDGAVPYLYARDFLGGKVVANWTREDMRGFVNWLQPFGVWSHSFDEVYDQTRFGGPNYVPYGIMQHTPQHDWLDEFMAEKLTALAGKSVFLDNYDDKYLGRYQLFHDDSGNIRNPVNDVNRNALTSKDLARAGLAFFNKTTSNVARANLSIYPGTGVRVPFGWRNDYILDYGYSRLSMAAGPNLAPVGFNWPSIEGYGIYGTFAFRHEYPNGTLHQNEDVNWPDLSQYAAVMRSLIRAGGTIMWDNQLGQLPDTDKPFIDNVQREGARDVADRWSSPNGSPQPANGPGPIYSPRKSKSINNMTLQAGEDYAELAQAGGTAFLPRAYQIDKGNGYENVGIDNEIPLATSLKAARDFHGMCDVSGAGNDAAIYFRDPTVGAGKNQKVKMTLANNATVEFFAQGSEPVRIRGTFQPNTNTVVAR